VIWRLEGLGSGGGGVRRGREARRYHMAIRSDNRGGDRGDVSRWGWKWR
jgi:hypothetical protein